MLYIILDLRTYGASRSEVLWKSSVLSFQVSGLGSVLTQYEYALIIFYPWYDDRWMNNNYDNRQSASFFFKAGVRVNFYLFSQTTLARIYQYRRSLAQAAFGTCFKVRLEIPKDSDDLLYACCGQTKE